MLETRSIILHSTLATNDMTISAPRGFFINTDAISNGLNSYHDHWIERGIAVTSGKERYRERIDSLQPGLPVFLYVRRLGVVAAGHVLDNRAVKVEDRAQMVSPIEPFEYHRKMHWFADIRDALIDYREVMALRGGKTQAPRQAAEAIRVPRVANELMSWVRERSETIDIARIVQEFAGRSTEAMTWVATRRGQGDYRKALLALWEDQCAVTGCKVTAALRASHALAWCDARPEQRLDPHNGLPLLASLDALFDVGLIGFDDDGRMLCSPALDDADRALLQLPAPLRKRPNETQRAYLRAHRNRFGLLPA